MHNVTSIRPIIRQYSTGERPLLVECSDYKTRVCKYIHSSASAHKMICEVAGGQLAEVWSIGAPPIDWVTVKPHHIPAGVPSSYFDRVCVGSEFQDGVIDITPMSFARVPNTEGNLMRLLQIALFDFWTANEDRNVNNANLMYDVERESLVPIDFGCLFNTATLDGSLSQLTSTETILSADLFYHLIKGRSHCKVQNMGLSLASYFGEKVEACEQVYSTVASSVPTEWNVPQALVETKMRALFDASWVSDVWDNFVSCLEENIAYAE